MEPLFAVIDTNVMISGLLSPAGHPARIVEMLRTGEVRAVIDDRILCEYSDVIKRPEFRFPPHEVDILLERILSFAVYAAVGKKSMFVDMLDTGDIPFAECAIAFGCPIVTGNKKHFKHEKLKNLPILSPAEFTEYIRSFSG